MASVTHVAFGILTSAAFWTILGLPIAESVVTSRMRALFLAPALGWCVYSTLALLLFSFAGMSQLRVLAVNLLLTVGVLAYLWLKRKAAPTHAWPTAAELMALFVSALLAFVPTVAVLPKVFPDGVGLAWPIFDHSKIAMIDEMIRSGVPAINPFFGESNGIDKLVYYYLWHFSAAVLGSAIGLSGWEADAALTWFTSYATLSMMIGFAVAFGGRPSSALWVVALAATSSARPILGGLFGDAATEALVGAQTGFGSWLFQSTWAPQHAASGMAVVLACFLLTKLADRPTPASTILLAVVGAAGYQSSIWVGGVVFVIAATAIAAPLAASLDRKICWRFMAAVAGAAAICIAIIAPFVIDQATSAAMRGALFPLRIEPLWIFGSGFPPAFGEILNLPAYWLLYLPVEFPAYYLSGVIAAIAVIHRIARTGEHARAVRGFAGLIVVSLVAGWLLVSVIGDNNDLGWRAVLPGSIVLIVLSAVGLSHWVGGRAVIPATLAICGLLCGLPGAIELARGNYIGEHPVSARAFVDSKSMWEAVRRNSTPDERVANNPLFLSDMTPWPVNISWALLADRRSCYAGNELALPFAPISAARREHIDAQFQHLFAGDLTADDLDEVTLKLRCDLIVITVRDGAWARNPFTDSSIYKLVEDQSDAWRIYRRIRVPQPQIPPNQLNPRSSQ